MCTELLILKINNYFIARTIFLTKENVQARKGVKTLTRISNFLVYCIISAEFSRSKAIFYFSIHAIYFFARTLRAKATKLNVHPFAQSNFKDKDLYSTLHHMDAQTTFHGFVSFNNTSTTSRS